jgi:polar amino acid transport system substrate-binding protein
LFAAVLSLAVVTAGCGSSSSDGAKSTTTAAGDEVSCKAGELPLKEPGTLNVATGEPAFEPWVVDDKPENGKGFESAVVYAVADQLGIDKGDVTWSRTGFDEAVAPGDKDFDFNVQQAVIASPDSELADASSLADLQDVQLGAAIGTTSLDYIDEYIKPSKEPLVFDDNAAAKSAFDAGQVDGIVFDLPTAYYITSAEITDSTIVGVLPQEGDAEELGLLFEDGSPLVSCVNEALATLKDDGTLADLEEQYLNQGGDIPTLTK